MSEFSAPAFPERFNMARYFLDDRVAEGRGDHVAVVDDRGRHTYRQVQAMANRVANALVARGVSVEDRVLIGLFDSVEFVAAFFGILKAGAVVTMVNPELPDADYEHYLSYTRARALLADVSVTDRIAPELRASKLLRGVISAGDSKPAFGDSWRDAVDGASDAFENFDSSKDDPSAWLFTSGSTGKPKGAVHLHHDFPYNTECYAKRILGITKDDVTLGVPKLFFGYATGSNLMFPFAVGGTTVLFRDRATPERVTELSKKHGVTILTSVPTMINKMVQAAAADAAARSLAPMRAVISAGEALPAELYHRWMETFGVEILDGIGSAELFHIYITNRPGGSKPGSLGTVVPGYEAKIVGADGREVADGEIGTLWVKGDSAAICYWQAHEKSKEVLRGDWVVSGDLFRRDADGYFYYAGRADDMLKVGGIFVSPMEVESCLLRHPHVLEAAVVGYEDDDGLVKAMAFVVAKNAQPSAELERAIIEHAKKELVHYKAPRKVQFVDALPRSDRGKILPSRIAIVKRLAELTWTEAAALRARDPIVLLPIGSTEAHGPHLPLGTDAILSDELALRAAAALEAEGRVVVIAATLAYAITDYAGEFAGTISLSAATATALVAEVCARLVSTGFARVCLVNSHLEPAHVASLKAACARVEAETGTAIAFADQLDRRWARTLTDEYKRGACHAGSYETSLVLAARPELVRDEVRRGLVEMPIDLARAMKEGKRTFGEAGAPEAYFGDPAAATVEEGNDIYARLVTMVVTTVREAWP